MSDLTPEDREALAQVLCDRFCPRAAGIHICHIKPNGGIIETVAHIRDEYAAAAEERGYERGLNDPGSAWMTGARREATAALAEQVEAVLPACYVTREEAVSCLAFIDGTFENGAVWTEAMCCVPCRVRAALRAGEGE